MSTLAPDTSAVVAPPAPGRLGSAPVPGDLQRYLEALDGWLRARRAELDALDQAAMGAGRGADVASDMALSLSLWKAVSDRYQRMWSTWDGGRVLQQEREAVATLIWSRLDSTAGSVPEACRLSDALAAQLRSRLALAPGADAAAARVRALRAQLERIRDQVGLEPATSRDAAVDRLAGLMARLQAVTEKAGRGGDVGGLLGPLESEAAVFERDLIVGNQRRRDARGQLAEARRLREQLVARAGEVQQVAATCVGTVTPAPRYAVPDPAALGPVPNTPGEIEGYLERLGRVEQALTVAAEAYAGALAEHTDLVALLDAYVAKATSLGVAGDPDLAASEQRARDVLDRRPSPVGVCRQLVTTYQTWLAQHASRPPDQETP